MIIKGFRYLENANFKAFEMDFSNKGKSYTALISYGKCVLIRKYDNADGAKVEYFKDYLVTESDLSNTTLKHIKEFSGLNKKEFLALCGDYTLNDFVK